MTFQKIIDRYIYTGVAESNAPETNRKIIVTNLFGAVGMVITLLLAITASINTAWPLASSLYVASFVFMSCHLYIRLGRSKQRHNHAARILLACLMLLMIYLVYSGGNNNTGPLWIYLVPPVAMFFGGMKNGLLDTAIFILIVSAIMFYPDNQWLDTSYSTEFKSRLVYSFLTVTFLSAFYEYSRQQSYKELLSLSEKFEQQARQDSLTGLTNRRGMQEHLEYEFSRSLRSKLDMALVLIDVDHFKSINDRYGHDYGDLVLQQLATLITFTLRKQDIVARWGGEEFLILLPETNCHDGYILAEKLRQRIAQHAFGKSEQSLQLTISAGICQVTQQSGIDHAISQADHFLYQAKSNGRNQTAPEPAKLG